MRTMHTGSSSSRPPRKPRQSVQPPPKETEKIHDRNWCSNTFSKRHKCIINKQSKLSELPDVHVAVIMFSPGDQLECFGSPSIEEVFLMYLLREYDVKLPMSPKEGVVWAEKVCESCLTKQDCAFLIMNYLDAVVRLLKKLVGFENDPSFLQPVRSLSRRNMQTGSSPDPKRCSNMFSKRSNCILNKASELSKDTGTPVAVIMFSPAGNLKSFGWPSIEEVFLMYLRHKYGVKPSMSAEAERECESCLTKEECPSLIMTYLEAVFRLLKKLNDFEVDEIFPLIDDFGAIAPEAYYDIFFAPYFALDHGDSAAGGESSGVDSNSTCVNIDECLNLPEGDFFPTWP